MNLFKWFQLWQYKRAIQRERLDRIRESIRIAGRSGIQYCNTIGKPPDYGKERASD